MAGNRRNQSAAIRFGPAIKALLLCGFIVGVGIGYVWQRKQNMELSQQIGRKELQLEKLRKENSMRRKQLDEMHLPANLERRARELNLGLKPANATQVVRLPEPPPE